MTKPTTAVEVVNLRRLLAAVSNLADGESRDASGVVAWSCGCKCRSRIEHGLRVSEQAFTFIASRSAGPQGKGSHSDPVFTIAYPSLAPLGKPEVDASGKPKRLPVIDPSPEWLEQFSYAVQKALPALLDLQRILRVVGTIESSDPLAATGSGFCWVDHERYCRGGDDRLKASMCGACYKAWNDAGRPDRYTFRGNRQAWLALKAEAEEHGEQPISFAEFVVGSAA